MKSAVAEWLYNRRSPNDELALYRPGGRHSSPPAAAAFSTRLGRGTRPALLGLEQSTRTDALNGSAQYCVAWWRSTLTAGRRLVVVINIDVSARRRHSHADVDVRFVWNMFARRVAHLSVHREQTARYNDDRFCPIKLNSPAPVYRTTVVLLRHWRPAKTLKANFDVLRTARSNFILNKFHE